MCSPRVTQHTSIRYSSSCPTRVNMGTFCLHRRPVSVNSLYHARMVLSVRGSFAYFARNARSTVTTDLFVWYSNTQNDFTPGAANFLNTYTRIAQRQKCELRWKTTYWENIFWVLPFYLYMFRKYVSCGFPIIHFCNPGVHYETPCISTELFFGILNQWKHVLGHVV